MAQKSLGKVTVTTPGTPVRLTLNQSDPTARYAVHAYMVQALSSNTGKIYIGSASMNKTTLAGVYAYLPVPTASLAPAFSASVALAAANFMMNEIYLDADVGSEGAIVSAIIA